jgi:PIN domain nuclease of toxin-antitoxin system
VVVLDTHVVVWWASDPHLLSSRAARAISRADRLGIPAIVFWETALLVRKRKLDLGMSVHEWAANIQAIPRVDPLPLTADIALLADSLNIHPDPVDRFIVATAIHHGVAVVTKDRLLRPLRIVKTIW